MDLKVLKLWTWRYENYGLGRYGNYGLEGIEIIDLEV